MPLNSNHKEALAIAKILFERRGYPTYPLEQIGRALEETPGLRPEPMGPYTIHPTGFRSNYEVRDANAKLVCITVYKKGAVEAARLLNHLTETCQCHNRKEDSTPKAVTPSETPTRSGEQRSSP